MKRRSVACASFLSGAGTRGGTRQLSGDGCGPACTHGVRSGVCCCICGLALSLVSGRCSTDAAERTGGPALRRRPRHYGSVRWHGFRPHWWKCRPPGLLDSLCRCAFSSCIYAARHYLAATPAATSLRPIRECVVTVTTARRVRSRRSHRKHVGDAPHGPVGGGRLRRDPVEERTKRADDIYAVCASVGCCSCSPLLPPPCLVTAVVRSK